MRVWRRRRWVGIERAVRPYSPDVVRRRSRLKTGAEKPKIKPYVGRAEFFALPRLAPHRPLARWPFRPYLLSTSNAFLTLSGRRIRSPRFTLGEPLKYAYSMLTFFDASFLQISDNDPG